MAVQISFMAVLVFLPFVFVSIRSAAYLREESLTRARADVLREAHHISLILESSFDRAYGLIAYLSRLPQFQAMDGARASPFLSSAKNQVPALDSILLVNAKGRILALVPSPTDPVNDSGGDSYSAACTTRTVTTSWSPHSSSTGRPLFSLSVPVVNSRDRMIGAVIARYDLATLRRILSTIDLPHGTTVEVADPRGVIIIRKEGIEGRIGDKTAEMLRQHKVMDRSEGVVLTRGREDRRYFVGSAPLSIDARPLGWVRIRVPFRAICGPEERILVIDSLLMLALGLLSVLGALVFARIAILKRVSILIRTAEAFSRGELRARTGLDFRASELGGIAYTLDRMAESIATQRRFADTLLDNIDEGMVVCGSDGRIEFANDVVGRWHGRELRRLPLDEWATLVKEVEGDEPLRPERSPLARAFRGERVRNSEVAIRSPGNPTPRYLICSGGPLYREQGEREGAILLMRDITDLRQATNQLVAMNTQLIQAQKMEAIGRLSGGMAHDFNNILTVISGFNHMILGEDSLRPAVRGYATEVKKAAMRASELTRQLLIFSRAQVVEPRIVDLNGLLSSLAKMLGRLVGEDIRLDMTLSNDLWMVKVDPTQIEQVVMNLATNARDAMPRGGRLAIETANLPLREQGVGVHHRFGPGDYVRLTVSDTGVGMSEETLAKVFEPFFTTKPAGKGTGLGLSTVYGIVHHFRGHVAVDSELRKGTSVQIFIPRAQNGELGSDSSDDENPAPGGSERLLVVEDDGDVARYLKAILERAGYGVSAARTAEEALAILENADERIDLLITDVVMPGMSGIDLVKRTRRLRPELRIVVISGYTRDVVLERGSIEPGVAFLSKPLTAENFLGTIWKILENDSARR